MHSPAPALMDNDDLSTVPVCNCHRRRNSLPGPGKFNTVHFSAPGHVGSNDGAPSAPQAPISPGSREPGVDSYAQRPAADAPPVPGPQTPQDIPIQYIVDQLHRLGPFYWHKPETTDCTIRGLNTGVLQNNLDIRRGSAPVSSQTNPTPKSFTTLKLHQFYLTAQSSLLRALFSGSSVIGLVSPQTPSVPSSSTVHYALGSQSTGRKDSMPSLAKIPRLLPSSAHHPTLYLPLPDPSSFPHIVHYLYFGSPAFIEEALSLGRIRWDGVVRNVEYLGLFEEEGGVGIRRWLAEWRERQRRARVSHMGHPTSHIHHPAAHVNSYVPTGTAIDPILVEESSEESTSEGNADSEMADSDDMYDDMDDEGDDEQQSNGIGEWDPLSLAIAGMKMADPFALDLNGYARQRVAATGDMPMESVDPLHG